MSPHSISDEQLIAYANQELDASSVAVVAAHVTTCARCQKFVALFHLVRAALRQDAPRTPSLPTLQKAYALALPSPPHPTRPLWQLHPAYFALALVLGLLALLIGAAIGIAAQEIPTDSALYPVKSAVESFQTTVSDTWRSLGGARAPTQPPPHPTTQTPSPPSISPGQTRTPPGQARTPPGQINTPPGQARTPPGQINTPPGQARTPPGQVNTPPGQVRTPPGQVNTPPGQVRTPPGQVNTPPGQMKTSSPPNTPPGSKNEPPGKGDEPPKGDNNPPEKKNK